MTTATRLVVGTLALSLLGLLVPRAAAGKEVPAPNGKGWDSTEGPPSWIDAPAPSADVVCGVVAAQSDQLSLAASPGKPDARWLLPSIAASIVWRLRPVLGEGADAMFDLALAAPPTTRCAYHLTPPRRGEALRPGAQTATAWTRWEIPIATVLEKVPADRRDEVRKALAAAEPDGTPPWTEVRAKPAWTAATPATADLWTVVVEETADRADVARAQSVALAGERVAESITEPLRERLGSETAWDVARRAATWRRCTHRASSTTGDRPPAWARFEIPMARILAAVPEDQRDAVRKILVPPPSEPVVPR